MFVYIIFINNYYRIDFLCYFPRFIRTNFLSVCELIVSIFGNQLAVYMIFLIFCVFVYGFAKFAIHQKKTMNLHAQSRATHMISFFRFHFILSINHTCIEFSIWPQITNLNEIEINFPICLLLILLCFVLFLFFIINTFLILFCFASFCLNSMFMYVYSIYNILFCFVLFVLLLFSGCLFVVVFHHVK